MSFQRRPAASPRRSPVSAISSNRGRRGQGRRARGIVPVPPAATVGLGSGLARHHRVPGDVGDHEIGTYRITQGGSKGGVYSSHAGDPEAARSEVAQHCGYLGGAELTQPDVAHPRDEMNLDMTCVLPRSPGSVTGRLPPRGLTLCTRHGELKSALSESMDSAMRRMGRALSTNSPARRVAHPLPSPGG